MGKLLYSNFLENKKVYNLNVGFWQKIFNKILKEKNYSFQKKSNTTFANGLSFYDGNPIFDAIIAQPHKAIRIIQEEPTSQKIEISAWVEDTELEKRQKIEELVISLELSRETKMIVQDFIKAWVIDNFSRQKMEKFISQKIEKSSLVIA
jgi:hypothetical protein